MPIDPPEPIHDTNFLATKPGDAVWQSASVNDPSGTALGYIKSQSTGAIWHVGPDDAGSGSVKWLGSTSLSSGGGGLLMTQADANRVIAATGINGSGQLVSSGGPFAGRQQHYTENNPLSGTPLYTKMVVYKLV